MLIAIYVASASMLYARAFASCVIMILSKTSLQQPTGRLQVVTSYHKTESLIWCSTVLMSSASLYVLSTTLISRIAAGFLVFVAVLYAWEEIQRIKRDKYIDDGSYDSAQLYFGVLFFVLTTIALTHPIPIS